MNTENQYENLSWDMPKNQSNVIKVIGVGGGGSNAINYMYNKGINGVDYVICNTDAQALENSPVPNKVQLGINLTEGMGAGADPKIGEKAAIESLDVIKKMLDNNTKMVFITAGMGGGTGTGAAPIISSLAMEMGILTVGIVTMPFIFEGKIRTEQANLGLEKLRGSVDSLVVINNNKLREMYGNLGVKEGFTKADEVLATAAKGIAEVITNHYTQNIDLKDAKTVLSKSGNAIMGSFSASGEKRALKAVTNALDSPLLNDNRISGAQNVLLLIVSGSSEITIDEIGIINDYIQEKAGNKANIIMGIGEDQTLSEEIAVTVIATGFDMKQQDEILHIEPKKTIFSLEDENPIIENVEKDQKPLQFENASQSIDFKNIDFETENLEINNNHKIKKEEILDIDVTFEEINKKTDSSIDSTIDEEILLKKLDDIEVVEPVQVLKNQEKNYSLEKNELKYYLKSDIKEIEVIDPMHIIPYVTLENNSFQKNADDNLENENNPIINPVESPIVEGLAKRTEQRRIKLKKFNYKFTKSTGISDLESEPAYKRAGISLDDEIKSSISSSTLNHEDGGKIDVKSNNTFLHDNVD
ncbi:cell division protein FtsZ [Flavobacteriales bacterium]|nr:cell division protein FtsZ [Flavobacteriales bacterium]